MHFFLLEFVQLNHYLVQITQQRAIDITIDRCPLFMYVIKLSISYKALELIKSKPLSSYKHLSFAKFEIIGNGI